MKRYYVLSPGAAADLRAIARYTVEKWGEQQARRYLADLEAAAEGMASGTGAFIERGDILPGLRMVWSGKHCIFCMPREGRPAVILAVLHERMDIVARLIDRLG